MAKPAKVKEILTIREIGVAIEKAGLKLPPSEMAAVIERVTVTVLQVKFAKGLETMTDREKLLLLLSIMALQCEKTAKNFLEYMNTQERHVGIIGTETKRESAASPSEPAAEKIYERDSRVAEPASPTGW